MSEYKRNRSVTDQAIRRSGIMVVMNKKHVRSAEHLVETMWEVYQAGYVAECTFRIDTGIIREAMAELTRRRQTTPADKPFILAVGSIINPRELQEAIEMGFDAIVAPGAVMGGFGEGKDFVRITHELDIWCAPAIFTPTEFNYYLERPDGLEPDAIKIFPADSHGPSGIKALLAPFARARHHGKLVMPTGGVSDETGPHYQEAIAANGFEPILGMSHPLRLVEQKVEPGNLATIRESLLIFRKTFRPIPNLAHNGHNGPNGNHG